MTTALVTGAAGFVGSHLSKELENRGYKLKLVDDFSRGKKAYLEYLKVDTPCEYHDLKIYSPYLFEGVDEVYHIASRIGGNQFLHGSPQNELIALQDNSVIDRNVFKACVQTKVRKVIYTSSVSVYNTTIQQNFSDTYFSEESLNKYPIDPEGGYGWAKFIGEKQLELMSKFGIKTGITRIFKSYGPCDDYSDESGQVVCTLMRKAKNYPKEKYVLWGEGSVTRCLVYIDDLINGIMKLSEYCNEDSLTVNLGGNIPHTMRSLASKIKDISNKKDMQIENDMSKPVGVKSRIPDLTLAKEKLGWKPKTSLEEGLKRTWSWMMNEQTEKEI